MAKNTFTVTRYRYEGTAPTPYDVTFVVGDAAQLWLGQGRLDPVTITGVTPTKRKARVQREGGQPFEVSWAELYPAPKPKVKAIGKAALTAAEATDPRYYDALHRQAQGDAGKQYRRHYERLFKDSRTIRKKLAVHEQEFFERLKRGERPEVLKDIRKKLGPAKPPGAVKPAKRPYRSTTLEAVYAELEILEPHRDVLPKAPIPTPEARAERLKTVLKQVETWRKTPSKANPNLIKTNLYALRYFDAFPEDPELTVLLAKIENTRKVEVGRQVVEIKTLAKAFEVRTYWAGSKSSYTMHRTESLLDARQYAKERIREIFKKQGAPIPHQEDR